jgi:hypothetical protein
MHHTTYFGDGEKTFALTTEMILELERKTGVGIGTVYSKLASAQFHYGDLMEVIRLGLIGGGTAPVEAQTLVDTYAKPRPIDETFPLALDILDARWSGKPDAPAKPLDELRQSAAATGDMSAAINEALAESGL